MREPRPERRGGGAASAASRSIRARNGERFAYRLLGEPSAQRPTLLLLPTFWITMDDWDPLLLEALALQRQVVLFDGTGVGATTGAVQSTVRAMAADAVTLLDALVGGAAGELPIDVLGHGLGGMVAQHLAVTRPGLVRRLVLAGTSPPGGVPMHRWPPDVEHHAAADRVGPEQILRLLFDMTPTSRAQGRAYLARLTSGTRPAPAMDALTAGARQRLAGERWLEADGCALRAAVRITAPTLVVGGDNDALISPRAVEWFESNLPDVRVRVFPDAGHGFPFQYPLELATLVASFLA